MEMFPEVRRILAKQLRIADPSTITLESQIKKLGADSLDILQLLMRIEDDYGIVIPDEELATFVTVGDVVAYLDRQQKQD
ncbi:MAG: acyl carrier protein [Bacteroidales bacterium]|nr:acyl carrier protein [Bacteroidales bacterium]